MNLLRKAAAPSEAPIQHVSSQQVYLNPLENLNDQHQVLAFWYFLQWQQMNPLRKHNFRG